MAEEQVLNNSTFITYGANYSSKIFEQKDGNYENRFDYLKLFKKNWKPTLAYCAAFLSFGISVGFIGPTLLDLSCLTSTTQDLLSWIFFAQLFFTLIGALISGGLSHR